MEFEWDEEKRIRNIAKHGIDFALAIHIFDRRVTTSRSDRAGERRFVAVGAMDEIMIAVIYTDREYHDVTKRRIISARTARTYEKARYRAAQYG